ncbi:conserved domain protein [Photobacterium aphoticum]|uniref:Conserved domain protein n=1 Tax=Photobacterium aphoticum TaxID=754436 RepID=A0A090QJ96_9GAMM|nr:conserved domain protein [Photobacterium aphoticum]
MTTPILFIFSGLPGAGKSTLAQGLARETGAVYLRIDTIEQALRDLCQFKVEGEGYRLSYRVAKDNLLQGNSVIADCCNPISLTREEWQQVAISAGAQYLNIEVYCGDQNEHRFRVEHRENTVTNMALQPGPMYSSDIMNLGMHRLSPAANLFVLIPKANSLTYRYVRCSKH